jgi:protein-L-isoaspartate(D-aspartate) O-methyltransferase
MVKGGGGGDGLTKLREEMVQMQLIPRDIRDTRVLAAMGEVPRESFVSARMEDLAYEDRPLPIGFGQTISQPYMVARATELVAPRPNDRALEIGAGCGYQAAVLSRLCAQVFGVEIVSELAERARVTLKALGYHNAMIEAADGSGGWPAHAPYDVIVVSAATPALPAMLLGQLSDGGRLVAPVGSPEEQVLTLVRRKGAEYEIVRDVSCRYVSLIGRFVGHASPSA